MSKPRTHCRFCLGTGASKEHVFPEWMQKAFPIRETAYKRSFGSVNALPGVNRPEMDTNELRQGDIFSRKVRKYCTGCNSGWMGDLQEEAKPFLLPMMLGQSLTLDDSAFRSIAKWITMTSIVVDSANPPLENAVTRRERRAFYQAKHPFLGWQIRVGHFAEHSTWRMYHHFTSRLLVSSSPETIREGRHEYVAVQLVIVGNLFYHVVMTSLPFLTVDLVGDHGGQLIHISPVRPGVVAWPPPSPVTIDDIVGLEQMFGAFQDAGRPVKLFG